MNKSLKKILVVNVNWLGDVIFSTPVFKALKSAYPEAKIVCLAVPRVVDVLEMCPYIDEVLVYDEKEKMRSLKDKWSFVQKLKQQRFDAAFLIHRSFTRRLLTFLARIPIRVGFVTKNNGVLLTHKVDDANIDDNHRSDYYLRILEGYGVIVNDRTNVLSIDNKDEQQANEILKENGITFNDEFVVVNTGGNWDLKRWSMDCFAQLIDQLMKDFKIKVVIPGAAKDEPQVQEMLKSCQSKPTLLTGKTNLKELAAILQRANVVISADSGPLHLANCVGTDVIGIFGPTRPEITGPRGSGKSIILHKEVGCNLGPCYYLSCPDNVCMQAVTVGEVVEAYKTIKS